MASSHFPGGGGSGTIGGSIGSGQVAVGTGSDTIGGSADFTFGSSTLAIINAGKPLVNLLNTNFSSDPDDGLFAYQSDSGVVEFDVGYGTSGGLGAFFTLDPSADTLGSDVIEAFTSIKSDEGLYYGDDANHLIRLFPSISQAGFGQLDSKINVNAASYAQTDLTLIAREDPVNHYASANVFFGATNGTSPNSAYSIGWEGNYSDAGAFAHHRLVAFDQVNGNTIWFIDDLTPNTFIFPDPISVLIVDGLTVQGAVGSAGFLTPDQTAGHTAIFQAYDVDGTAFKTFATLTNNNTPDFTISPPSGGTVNITATNYNSSDGSAGINTTITTAGLVGKTITVKNGLITGFA